MSSQAWRRLLRATAEAALLTVLCATVCLRVSAGLQVDEI